MKHATIKGVGFRIGHCAGLKQTCVKHATIKGVGFRIGQCAGLKQTCMEEAVAKLQHLEQGNELHKAVGVLSTEVHLVEVQNVQRALQRS